MPILFVGYALAVWFLAARYRRLPLGFLAVAAGFAGLLLVNHLHWRLSVWTQGDIYLPVLRALMYPYTGLVAGVGLYIACIPRRHAKGCVQCGYDLTGLIEEIPDCSCPECGASQPPRQTDPAHARPSGVEAHELPSRSAA